MYQQDHRSGCLLKHFIVLIEQLKLKYYYPGEMWNQILFFGPHSHGIFLYLWWRWVRPLQLPPPTSFPGLFPWRCGPSREKPWERGCPPPSPSQSKKKKPWEPTLAVICRKLYNRPSYLVSSIQPYGQFFCFSSYSRIVIGSRLWSIRRQMHDWHHHYNVFPSVF